MKIRLHSEEDKKLSFWLNDLKNDYEESHQGIILDYCFYTDDNLDFTSLSLTFYPISYKSEIMIDIQNKDILDIIDIVRQKLFNQNLN